MDEGRRKSGLIREVNDRIRALSVQWDATESAGFFCECVNASCSEILDVTVAEYDAIRALSDCFVVVRGHESCDEDRVVAARNDHVVVNPVPPASGAQPA